ncbi:MAG: hypothetical protein LBJ99_03465, partial [Oscillospiraceae bacterium]|nr:hypothetical protein [Oscillospiraceae bacterium]
MRRNVLAVSWLKRALALLVALAVIAAPRVYASADTPPPPDGELPENAAEEPVDETEEETGDETEPPYVWLPQSEFGFSDPCPPDIRYNANGNIFVNPAVGEASGSETVYSIVDGAAAVIDPATGVLTIISAGTVTVRAYREGDETYLPACAEYTLTVLRADRSLAFDKPGANCAYYGVGFENAASPDAGSGAITYSVVSGGDIA